jgi:uncharacterized phage-associated protein
MISINSVCDYVIFRLTEGNENHNIDAVLETYAKYSGSQLEEMNHKEDPWIRARVGYEPTQKCEKEIDENLMRDYYKARLN